MFREGLQLLRVDLSFAYDYRERGRKRKQDREGLLETYNILDANRMNQHERREQ